MPGVTKISRRVKVRCSQIALRHSQAEQQQVKFGSHLAFVLGIFNWIFGYLFKCECVVVVLWLNDKMFIHCLLIVIPGSSEYSLISSMISRNPKYLVCIANRKRGCLDSI